MPEISAAMGLTGLDSFADFVSANRRNHERYRAELSRLPGLGLVGYDEADTPNYGYVVVEVDEAQAGLDRDTLYRCLHAENVLARRYFYPGVHRMEPYRSLFPHASLLLPETEALVRRVLVLPTGVTVSESDVSGVAALLRFLIEHHDEVRARLPSLPPAAAMPGSAAQNPRDGRPGKPPATAGGRRVPSFLAAIQCGLTRSSNRGRRGRISRSRRVASRPGAGGGSCRSRGCW